MSARPIAKRYVAKRLQETPQLMSNRLTTTLWQRLLARLMVLDGGATALLRSCPVVTIETGGLCPVLVIECPRAFIFDLLGEHRSVLRLAASDVLDVSGLIVWLRLAPDATCNRLTDEEWVARAHSRKRHRETSTGTTSAQDLALPPGRLTRPPADPLIPKPSA